MYRELIERMTAHSQNIVDEAMIEIKDADYDRYCSLYAFDRSICEHVKVHKTVSGFEGLCHSKMMFFDFDSEHDVAKSQNDCLRLVYKLNSNFGIRPMDLYIYFSGNKGFHLGLHSRYFGGFEPSKRLANQQKLFAKNICFELPTVDFGLYQNVRFFRIPNSKNSKSGLYKIELTFEELQDCSIDEIRQIASSPRPMLPKRDLNSIYKNESVVTEWLNSVRQENETGGVSKGRADGKDFFEPAGIKHRNNVLHAQACSVFTHSELSKSAVSKLMWGQNMLFEPPLEKEEFDTILDSAYRSTEIFKKQEKTKKSINDLSIKPFSGWVDEYLDYMFHASSKMTSGFKKFDEILKGRLKGKLGCIIGYGGSKKSLFALNSGLKNMFEYDCVVIYSTMEMSANQLIERIVDYMVDAGYSNAVYALEKHGREYAHKVLREQVAPLLGNKLFITQNAAMTCEGYDKMIEQVLQQTGRVDMLIVDGLSMMGGEGKETEKYSDNTAQLKEIANKWNLYVQLMCHVSKGAEKHTRDLIDKVRGSEKIFDNSDFVITKSQIIDEENSNSEVTEYRRDKGYARIYDKRGSGKTCNVIYNFDSYRLMLEETNEDPKMYEVKSKRKTQKDDFSL